MCLQHNYFRARRHRRWFWATTGTSVSSQAGTQSGEGETGPPAPATPADVKGSMTVQQVLDAFPTITAAQVLTQFRAPLDTRSSTKLKDLVQDSDGMDLPAVRIRLEKQTAL